MYLKNKKLDYPHEATLMSNRMK